MEISHISDLNAYSSLGSEGIVSKIPLIHTKNFAFRSWEKHLNISVQQNWQNYVNVRKRAQNVHVKIYGMHKMYLHINYFSMLFD